MNDFLLLIDGSSLLSTQFYGNLPREILFAKTVEEKEQYYHKIMMTSQGVYTNAVFGFLRTLLKILREQKPAYLAVAWDLSRDTFRRELYADYKGNRSETLVPLKDQFELCQQVLERLGVYQLMSKEFEADDYCGSVAYKFQSEIPIKILTKDQDYLQLVTDQTHLWMMHSSAEKTDDLFQKYGIVKDSAKIPDRVFEFTPKLVEEEYGVPPCHINSLKGLQGDPSDNIKGVPGVGPATAVKLIQEYGTVDRLYKSLENLDKEKEAEIKKYWKEKLGLSRSPLSYLIKKSDTEQVGEASARLSEQLATIKCDIPLEQVSLDTLKCHIREDELSKVAEELEFKSLNLKLSEEEVPKRKENFQIQDDFSLLGETIKHFMKEKCLGIFYQSDVGLAVASKSGDGYFFPQQFFITEDILAKQVQALHNAGVILYTMEGKAIVKLAGIVSRDVSLAAYLDNPMETSYPYEIIAKKYLNQTIPSEKELLGKISPKDALMMLSGELCTCFCNQALTAVLAGPIIEEKLKEEDMISLYENIELPLVGALARMEVAGIHVEGKKLKEFSLELSKSISALEKDIYDMTGENFNINSPKQLGEILFEKMKLPGGKKTKNGYSTAADVLEKLAGDTPVVQKILDYRTLTKLKSTYADGLQTCIQEDGRIHGTFNQTITATGRISSTNPNLQNIPVRLELGREIRKVFVPKEGCVFVDADYSQIELRVLAHMSGDENLIAAYRDAKDIHALTASQVFHVPLDQVTPLQRRNAKAVNFGIIYGISAFSLSEDLSITRKEALEYMERYFASYPKIDAFLKGLVEQGRNQGYVTTLYGRRRPIPELSSSNFMQRSFGERVAMNSPIQGTAADIMKIAMIHVEERLIKEQLKSKIVLQIHDELLVEAPLEEASQVEKILVEEMMGAAHLSVPLDVEAKRGNSWYATK